MINMVIKRCLQVSLAVSAYRATVSSCAMSHAAEEVWLVPVLDKIARFDTRIMCFVMYLSVVVQRKWCDLAET